MSATPLTLALCKGRILEQSLPLLEQAGIQTITPKDSRQLFLESNLPGLRLIIVRNVDMITYISHGAADLGIAGRDLLLEYEGDELYDPMGLGIAACRMMYAVPISEREAPRRPRVATKYPRSTQRYFSMRGLQVDLVPLYGSVELAPLLGLADHVVDLVDTGTTLRAHGLRPVGLIEEISARLVVNKAAMKLKYKAVRALMERLRQTIAEQQTTCK